jgi:hypothetical protein
VASRGELARHAFRSFQVLCKLVQNLQRSGKNSAFNERLLGENMGSLMILSMLTVTGLREYGKLMQPGNSVIF